MPDNPKVVCPACKSTDVKEYLNGLIDRQWESNTVNRFSYLRCSNCYSLFLYPVPSLNELSEFYPPESHYYAYQLQDVPRLYSLLSRIGIKKNIMATILKRVFFPFLKISPPGRVLDIGCGVGHFLNAMQGIGWKTWGMEMNEKSVEIAKRRHRVVRGVDLSTADLPEAYFDQITMFQVFEHIVEPVETLLAARKLLKPGGRIILGTPNVESREARYFEKNWRGLEYPRHTCIYGPKSIRYLFERTGFNNIQIRTRFAPSDIIDSLNLRAESRGEHPPVLCRIPRKIAMALFVPFILYGTMFDNGTGSLLEVVAIKDE